MLRGPAILCVVLLGSACAPKAELGGFDSGNPASRIYAIEDAMKRDDRAATKDIVEQLDSDDPAVRFVAIGALRRFWNEDYGYDYDDPPYLRQEAIQRWVDAVNEGRFDGKTSDG